MKRITLELDDETHAELKDQARADGRALVRFLERALQALAIKGRKAVAK
jgi:predicted transcriptional regulator